jgi:hypothetical protein
MYVGIGSVVNAIANDWTISKKLIPNMMRWYTEPIFVLERYMMIMSKNDARVDKDTVAVLIRIPVKLV